MFIVGENQKPHYFNVEITKLPKQVFDVIHFLKRKANRPIEVYMVGGAVRDYLYHFVFSTEVMNGYRPKDIDLTTNLTEDEILGILRSDEAVSYNISVKKKESIDTFGVVFVNCDGFDLEIAPFRKDLGSDGRRPEKTEAGTIYEDAARRDFTINNLYYDPLKKVVIDFNLNENGQIGAGINDIAQRVVKTVGDPFERFEEDKLRILRMVRFFHRFSIDHMPTKIDIRTREAIEKFRDLRKHGISGERIQKEFSLGFSQSKNKKSYLISLIEFGLMENIFHGMSIDKEVIFQFNEIKRENVALALMLEKNENVKEKLNKLNYPNSTCESVNFLISLIKNDWSDPSAILKERDRRIVKKENLTKEEKENNDKIKIEMILDLKNLYDFSTQPRIMHLIEYQPAWPPGEILMAAGFKGSEIGREAKRLVNEAYKKNFDFYLNYH